MRESDGGANLKRHLVDDVLAWWRANGPDEEHGGVLTCWNNAGTRLLSTDKYTWSQGRWTWLTASVARAAQQGILDVDADWYAHESERTASFLAENAFLEDGTTAFVTTTAGKPIESIPGEGFHTSVFADLFVALGFAGLGQLRPNTKWGPAAVDLLMSSVRSIEAGTFRSEPYPVGAGHRSFGLPMILVGVGEQVYRATGSDEAAGVVRDAAQLIETYFLDGDDIAEMPRIDGTDDGSLLVRHRTPGHILEAIWFLYHARDLIDGSRLADPACLVRVAEHALEIGWDVKYGGLLRYVDSKGGSPVGSRSADRYEQLVLDTWDTKLWWPHAEALYTTQLLASVTGDPTMKDWAQRVQDYTFNTFPEGPQREWTQNRDRAGYGIDKTVALPVKDPFHVARALLMAVEIDRQQHDGHSANISEEEK